MQQAEIFLQGIFTNASKAQEELTLILKYAQRHGMNGVRITNGPQLTPKEVVMATSVKKSIQEEKAELALMSDEDLDKSIERDMSDKEISG